MREKSAPGGILIAMAVCWMLAGVDANASEEAVDRATQAALALDAHPDRGAALFAHECAHCHGSQAQGAASRAVPSLAGQHFAYLVRQLANFAGGERDSDAMHRVLSKQQLQAQSWVDIAAYLNKAALPPHTQSGDGMHLALGQVIFQEQCATCHRPDAQGSGQDFVPSLRNQHFGYLVNQMHKLGEGYRHNIDENLARFLRSFDDPEMTATADFLSRLQGPGAVHPMMRSDGVVVD